MFELPNYQALHAKRVAVIDGMIREARDAYAREFESLGADGHMNGTEIETALAADETAMMEKTWLLTRQKGVSATEVAGILHLTKWKTEYQIWEDKIDPSRPPRPAGEAAYWGHVLEDAVAQEYVKRTGRRVAEVSTMQSAQYPFLVGSLDRVVLGPDGQAARVLEIKTMRDNFDTGEVDSNGYSIKAWGPGNVYERDPHTGEVVCVREDSQVPKEYEIQVMVYMIITGLRVADIAVLLGGQQWRCFTVHYDEELASIIIARMDEWWCRHVLEGIPPERVEADVKNLVPTGDSVEATPELVSAIAKYREVNAQSKALNEEKQRLKDYITGYIGESERVTYQGVSLCSYMLTKGRQRLDEERLAAEMPEVYRRYLTKGTDFRVLRLARSK